VVEVARQWQARPWGVGQLRRNCDLVLAQHSFSQRTALVDCCAYET